MTLTSPRGALPLAAIILLLLTSAVHALIRVGKGNDPVDDHNWPAGSLDLANLKTRVGWWEGPPFGGGQWTFLYRGDAAALQAAVDLFGKINTPELSLVVHEGQGESPFLKDEKDAKAQSGYDFSFTAWDPRSFNHLYNDPKTVFSANDPNGNFRRGSVEPPRIDVFVSTNLDWSAIKVPKTVKVTDERASANGYKAEAGSVMRGIVYDMVTSKPLAGASICIMNEPGNRDELGGLPITLAQSGADGRFEATKVQAGTHRVIVKADGYATRFVGYEQFKADTLREYVVRLAPAAELKGTVTDSVTGKPVQRVRVRADTVMGPDGRGYPVLNQAETMTDDQGAFTITGLPRGGHCQPFAHAAGYSMVDVLKLQSIPTDGGVALRVVQAGTIKARVVVPGGGAPKQQYMVSIEPEGGSKIGSYGGSGNVDATGVITFQNVPPGKYNITTRPNPGPVVQGKDPSERTIEVRGGETNEVKFEVK